MAGSGAGPDGAAPARFGLPERDRTGRRVAPGEIAVYDERHAFNLRACEVFAAVTGKIVNIADIQAL